MSSILILVLITYLVPVVLNLVSRSAERKTSGTIYEFCMRPAGGIAVIGLITATVAMMFIVLSSRAGQFSGGTAVVFSIAFIMGLLLMLAPVKGFWDTTVSGDDITSSRCWFIKQHAKVSDIGYCQQGRGSIHVYGKGSGRKIMSIDGMSTNIYLFEERMEKEGIEIWPLNAG